MRDRIIMHIDMNAFYASVAQHLDPSLRGKAVAVAGDPKKRNGIILAKSREAKAVGVKTAEAEVSRSRCCAAGLRGVQEVLEARAHDLLRLHRQG